MPPIQAGLELGRERRGRLSPSGRRRLKESAEAILPAAVSAIADAPAFISGRPMPPRRLRYQHVRTLDLVDIITTPRLSILRRRLITRREEPGAACFRGNFTKRRRYFTDAALCASRTIPPASPRDGDDYSAAPAGMPANAISPLNRFDAGHAESPNYFEAMRRRLPRCAMPRPCRNERRRDDAAARL